MPFSPTLRNILPWLFLATSALGCANVLDYDAISFDDDPGAYTGVSAAFECGTMPVPSLSCAQCVNTSCCSAADACATNTACGALAICRMRCAEEDVACLHDCGIDHFDGVIEWKALDACTDLSCGDSC